MSKWSEAWNKLPKEIRHIGSMCEAEMRVNQLKIEKNRLKKRYQQSITEVNEHIASLEHWIKTEEK